MSNEDIKKIENVPNACCTDPANIELERTTNPQVIIRRCRVCTCRHYFIYAEPGSMTGKLAK